MAGSARTVPRKSPRQERARATLDAILTATARVLVREGFDRASTNRIAEEAGVSIGSLYQYFPSKEALVAALVERHMDEMMGVVGEAFGRLRALPLAEAAREMVKLMVKAHGLDPRLHRVLTEQVPRVGRLDHILDINRAAMEMTRGYLEAHRHEIAVHDLELASFVAVEAVEALTHAALLHERAFDEERLIDEITRLVVRYLTA